MSLRSLLNRTVSVVPMNVTTTDRYRSEVRTPGAPIAGIPARRDQVAADEDLRDRDQQARTFVYLLALRNATGAAVAVSGRDRIVDGDDTLEIVGTPETMYRRRRPHHIEARAVIVEG